MDPEQAAKAKRLAEYFETLAASPSSEIPVRRYA
jgi:hypothetical protein